MPLALWQVKCARCGCSKRVHFHGARDGLGHCSACGRSFCPAFVKPPKLGAAAIAIALLAFVGCGSVTALAVDTGPPDAGAELGPDGRLEAGAELDASPDVGRLEAGVDEGRPDAGAVDASDDRCAPPAFACLGVRGGCAAGEEAATLTMCSVAAPVCCPAHVCDPAQCHMCTGCP